MPAAIQMLAALALFLVAVVILLTAIVIGAVFAKLIYAGARWVVTNVLKALDEDAAVESDAFPTPKGRAIPALPKP